MKKIIYALICGVLICISACRKYVEIPPENLRVLKTTADYQSLLYYGTLFDKSYYLPVLTGDDAGSDENQWQLGLTFEESSAYTWASKFYGAIAEDSEWDAMYNQIFNCNTVIQGVMASEGGTDQEKKKALSEALVQRAYTYYTLLNMYAKQYDANTAATDPGLPLVLEPKFTGSLARASVQKTYDQIVADLNEALPGLTDLPDFITNPSKNAVYAMMARISLNKRDFSEAERYSNLSLSLKSTLLDLNSYVTSTTLPDRLTNPEQIFFKKIIKGSPNFPLTASAVKLFDPNDLRFQIYTADKAKSGASFNNRAFIGAKVTTDGTGICVGPSVPEMMLIKAECEARANHPAVAAGILNDLRKKRFDATHYTDLTAATADVALRLVMEERGREFVGRGFRWFDQKRLSKDAGLITTVTRTYQGNTYTLEPGSNRYTYPIADRNIQLNPEIVQNPR